MGTEQGRCHTEQKQKLRRNSFRKPEIGGEALLLGNPHKVEMLK
jgi:hypothetical protein